MQLCSTIYCPLIDSHVNRKETDKLSKYKDWRWRSAGCGKWGQKLCQL